jgi:hypothetical protein
MAAPTTAAYVKKTLANPEPSTHGPLQTVRRLRRMSAFGIRRPRISSPAAGETDRAVLMVERALLLPVERAFRD